MRKITSLNTNWKFIKEDVGVNEARTSQGELIQLPHTWNNIDGQDGGNDYYRGTCYYVKELEKPMVSENEKVYLEFQGANSSAEIYVNGKKLARHDGGYSTFRVNITEELEAYNTIVVTVDNAPNRTVYPQKADFTFYGGIYRDVSLITVADSHFDLDYFGASGIKVTPTILGSNASIQVETFITGTYDSVKVTVEEVVSGVVVGTNEGIDTTIEIGNVHLWNGINDPFLYRAKVELVVCGKVVDEVSTKFGCRTFGFDTENGFLLNGKSYPLRGVSRHQDRKGLGNAISKEMHVEDMELIQEIGANTIRLAHYQHDQYFYDLCDERGMIIWAEIPYITQHLPEARENTLSQMRELVVQNYNHPSIICWGLSNEITASGGNTEDLIENHQLLNDLCHELDTTRPTTMAHVFMLEIDSPVVDIPDICSYNLYYGWYVGELKDNDEWFNDFHTKYPQKIIGLAEYGADASPKLQTEKPEKGDYSEGYQAIYHEHMIEMFSKRPYIWATHCWNMFDFAADGRDEGGEKGINQKGLVSFDRKVKKDAFYLYKAYLSDENFVHLCGRRYVDRVEDTTEIKVYTNLKKVALYCDGKLVDEKTGEKVFVFHVAITGEHTIEARSGENTDSITIRKVSEKNPSYELKERSIVNWFDKEECPEGYFSIKDKMGEITQTIEGAVIIENLMKRATASRGDVAQTIQPSAVIQKMLNGMSVEALLKQVGSAINPEMVKQLNAQLNKIKKPNN